MARFSIFKTPKPQDFKYHPRYYDPAKEELRARIERATPGEKNQDAEAMKARIRAGFQSKSSIDRKFQRKQRNRANYRVAAIAVIITMVIAYFIRSNWTAIEQFTN